MSVEYVKHGASGNSEIKQILFQHEEFSTLF